ncbi:hypothetical protein JTB14_019727 [Gonioctena quinquepunctata]|nr:hypothetical protein JTB14_019727 [Gonioctena quinquepunctata]
MERKLSMVITPDNFLEVVTESEGNYKVVFETICKMMIEKEKEKWVQGWTPIRHILALGGSVWMWCLRWVIVPYKRFLATVQTGPMSA